MYDAIVVGARCAGAPTAMLLARQGYRVLVVDRSAFPSDIMSTHYIKPQGTMRLRRWGLLDRVAATGCPPITRATFDYGDFALTGAGVRPEEAGVADYCPRRTVLDKILVDAAVEAGAELRERFTVEDLLVEDGRVTGIRGHGAAGASVAERARIVVGADGMRSLVARTVGAPMYRETPSLECGFYSYFSGVARDGIEIYYRPRRYVLVFPTNDGLACVAVAAPVDAFQAFRADIEGTFSGAVDLAPELAERMRGGRREERWIGTADVPNFFRKPYGPGWALVGDAGYHKDPAAGDGISDAFRDAELLVGAIDIGLGARRPERSTAEGKGCAVTLEDALAQYEQQRNAASEEAYTFTLRLASHQPPAPQELALMRAISTSEGETTRFFSVLAGTLPAAEFYAPANIARIMAAAGLGVGGR